MIARNDELMRDGDEIDRWKMMTRRRRDGREGVMSMEGGNERTGRGWADWPHRSQEMVVVDGGDGQG